MRPDEARVQAAAGTRLSRCPAAGEATCLELGTGQARFEVVTRAELEGAFVVRADDVEVRVLGTRFEVENGPGPSDVRVRVEEGRVSVERRGKRNVLDAGDTWPRALPPAAEPAPGTSTRTESSLASPERAPSRASRAAPESAPSSEARSRKRARPPRSPPAATAGRRGPPGPRASELWEAVDAARRAGDTEAERDAYGRILRSLPNTRDAGLAALALGRMELEVFGNSRLAASFLKDARRHLAGGSLEPEILVLLTRAYARSGDRRRCRAAAREYSARFPDGVYAKSLATECPEAR